ncbi:MAG: hypothetical protein CMF17_06485 [Idiomarinaceae bacterium]|nr:hypothetical protein [Idiomarinaceae bacterium]
MNNLKTFLLVGMVSLVSACSSIPLSTMVKLMDLNPLEADPNQIIVAVKSPDGVSVNDGDVVLDFSFRTGEPESSFKHTFPVIVDSDYALSAELKDELENDEQFTVMRLSAADAQRMKNGQKTIREYRSQHEEGGAGSINVRLISACQSGGSAWKDSELDVYLKTDQSDEFLLFLDDIELSELDVKNGC